MFFLTLNVDWGVQWTSFSSPVTRKDPEGSAAPYIFQPIQPIRWPHVKLWTNQWQCVPPWGLSVLTAWILKWDRASGWSWSFSVLHHGGGAEGGGASLVTFLNVSLELSRKSGEPPSLHQLTITIIMWLTTRKRSNSWLHNQSQQEAYLIYKIFQNKRSHQ